MIKIFFILFYSFQAKVLNYNNSNAKGGFIIQNIPILRKILYSYIWKEFICLKNIINLIKITLFCIFIIFLNKGEFEYDENEIKTLVLIVGINFLINFCVFIFKYNNTKQYKIYNFIYFALIFIIYLLILLKQKTYVGCFVVSLITAALY